MPQMLKLHVGKCNKFGILQLTEGQTQRAEWQNPSFPLSSSFQEPQHVTCFHCDGWVQTKMEWDDKPFPHQSRSMGMKSTIRNHIFVAWSALLLVEPTQRRAICPMPRIDCNSLVWIARWCTLPVNLLSRMTYDSGCCFIVLTHRNWCSIGQINVRHPNPEPFCNFSSRGGSIELRFGCVVSWHCLFLGQSYNRKQCQEQEGLHQWTPQF